MKHRLASAAVAALFLLTVDAAPAAPAAAASAVPAASAASGARVNDTIEFLNQRLAERLGSIRQPTNDGTMLLKVPARSLHASTPVAKPRPKPVAAAASSGAPAEQTPLHGLWSYDGPTGPQSWARLDPEFAQCNRGLRQSPVDVHDGIRVQLEPIEFDYRPSAFRVVDNGHTVQVNVAPGNAINVLGRRFELQQFHFHRPSENRLNGQQYEMEVHLVHKDDQGRLAVIAVMLERGASQPIVQMVWNNLPLEKGEEQAARVPLDPAALLPQDRRYYTFMGSLTTPPCSEGVLWMVMKKPVQATAEQLDIFARLYPMNARPLQPLAGRMVKESQ